MWMRWGSFKMSQISSRMNHNQNAHFDSMLKGWMGLGHESSFKANELLKEIEQTPLQASAFYESASSRVCRAKEIGTFSMLRFSLHEYFPTRPGPQSKFRLCILYEH